MSSGLGFRALKSFVLLFAMRGFWGQVLSGFSSYGLRVGVSGPAGVMSCCGYGLVRWRIAEPRV